MSLQPPSGQSGQTPPTGQQAPAAGAAPAAPAAGTEQDPFAGIQTEGRTPAEIEAEYRARLGGHQRGWNAAEQALRAENETLRQRLAASPAPTGQQGDDATAQRLAELQRQASEAEARATAAERMAKFPTLAQTIPDAKVFAALDEANLARLDAMIDNNVGASGTFIAPTAPRRTAVPPAPPTPLHEQSKEQLLGRLRELAPQVIEAERQRMRG